MYQTASGTRHATAASATARTWRRRTSFGASVTAIITASTPAGTSAMLVAVVTRALLRVQVQVPRRPARLRLRVGREDGGVHVRRRLRVELLGRDRGALAARQPPELPERLHVGEARVLVRGLPGGGDQRP